MMSLLSSLLILRNGTGQYDKYRTTLTSFLKLYCNYNRVYCNSNSLINFSLHVNNKLRILCNSSTIDRNSVAYKLASVNNVLESVKFSLLQRSFLSNTNKFLKDDQIEGNHHLKQYQSHHNHLLYKYKSSSYHDNSQSINNEISIKKWFMKEMMLLPNTISLCRLVSGLPISYLIIQDQWHLAIPLLMISGMSDWLDGYIAKKQKCESVLGSYLDPIADKTLLCCVVGALLYKGILPHWVAIPILARDFVLVIGSYVHYRRNQYQNLTMLESLRKIRDSKNKTKLSYISIKPLMISKINTVFQFCLVLSCLGHGCFKVPEADVVNVLSIVTVTTTVLSWIAYGHKLYVVYKKQH